MAFMTSFRDIWENQSLSRVPSLASDFGMYAYYVPWCIGEGTRDEGIYLVLSSKPIEDATKINIRELALQLGEFPCMNTEIMMIPLDAECKTDKSKAESIVNAEYASKVINKVVNDFSNNRGLPPDERIVKAIDEPEASPEENKGFEYSQIQTASKADDGKKMPEQDIFEPEPEQTQFVDQDFER